MDSGFALCSLSILLEIQASNIKKSEAMRYAWDKMQTYIDFGVSWQC